MAKEGVPFKSYPIDQPGMLAIDGAFTYHPPKPDQPARYEEIRDKARDLAFVISTDCPPSCERSLAITNLQQAVMWANAAIAVNEV